MNTQEKLLRLIYFALIEIRYEAQIGGDLDKIAMLSDLMHNVPTALIGNHDAEQVMKCLEGKASENPAQEHWLNNNLHRA